MGVAALDIETYSPPEVDDLDFLNTDHFRLLCIGVGYRATTRSTPEVDVIWREGIDIGDEYRCLARLCEWLNNRAVEEIVTYNGSLFDFRHLYGRAKAVGEEVGDADLPGLLHEQLGHPGHRDLIHEVVEDRGHRLSLEDAVDEYCGSRPPVTEWDGEEITNGRIPELGKRYLAHRSGLNSHPEGEALREAITAYTEADIYPLYDLCDALDLHARP